MKAPRITMVDIVTREHGDVFAEEFLATALKVGANTDAFAAAGVMTFPGDNRPEAQARHHEIADEIAEVACALTKRALAEAFVIAANVVLDRERKR
jgi:hypothetical protein